MMPHLCYLLPESRQTSSRGVLVLAIFHCFGEGFNGNFRRLEIWLSQPELHRVVVGHVKHPAHASRIDAVRTLGEPHHGLWTSVLGFE